MGLNNQNSQKTVLHQLSLKHLTAVYTDINPPFPASIASSASWIVALSVKRGQSKTIKSYLTGVRSAHVDLGYEDLPIYISDRATATNECWKSTPVSLERRPNHKGSTAPNFSQSFSIATPSKVLHYTQPSSLAFAAFLRIGEVTYTAKDRSATDFNQWFLTRRSVRLHKNHLELTLPASKTDPFRPRNHTHRRRFRRSSMCSAIIAPYESRIQPIKLEKSIEL